MIEGGESERDEDDPPDGQDPHDRSEFVERHGQRGGGGHDGRPHRERYGSQVGDQPEGADHHPGDQQPPGRGAQRGHVRPVTGPGDERGRHDHHRPAEQRDQAPPPPLDRAEAQGERPQQRGEQGGEEQGGDGSGDSVQHSVNLGLNV